MSRGSGGYGITNSLKYMELGYPQGKRERGVTNNN